MKNLRLFLTLMICLPLGMSAFAEKSDSLVADMVDWKLYKVPADGSYYITDKNDKPVFLHLKFVKPLGGGAQIIDGGNNTFFMDEKLKKVATLEHRLWVCGTVPHYVLAVVDNGKEFVVTEDETFYDAGNEVLAEPIARIDKTVAKRVFFINGESEFRFTSNYGYTNLVAPAPRTIFYECAEGFGVWGENTVYDAVWFENDLVKVRKNGLEGYYGITKTCYKSISAFNNYLAQFELPDGTKGYVDNEGNEYMQTK